MSSTTALADFVAKSRWEDCPASAVAVVRGAILDCLGVMLAGSLERSARILQAVALAEGGAPLCTVVGAGRRTGAVWAALCNGTAAHALDFDDTNFTLLGHPSAPVLAAALLAREGWTASEQALEGPQGFFNVLGAGPRRLEALDTLGAPWKILASGVAVKPYPSCACTHSIIDGTLELRRAHAIRPEDVAEVTV